MNQVKTRIYNPEKTKSLRQLGQVSIDAIRNDILEIPMSLWASEDSQKSNKFMEFHSTMHIIFKFVLDTEDCRTYYELPIWEQWKERLLPIIEQAVQAYGYKDGEFSRIMLARLSDHSDISIHKDVNTAVTYPHKIHIPIKTNEKCSFFINPDTFYFEEGMAYEVNNLKYHMVENGGDEERIHLIFEYYSKAILEKAIRDSVP